MVREFMQTDVRFISKIKLEVRVKSIIFRYINQLNNQL